jgi:hypothetical protein
VNILLLDGLPEEYEGIPISADFRNMIQVDLIMQEEGVEKSEKTLACLYQLYPDMPLDIHKAIAGLEWFFARGESASEEKAKGSKKNDPVAFSFEQDAGLIYAAFYSAYGISLTTIDFLHWWEFMALFEGLPEDTMLRRVMYWRTADLTGMSKNERKHVQKMRSLFALKGPERKPMTVGEIDQQTKDRVAQRFAEAQAAMEKQRKEAVNGI